MSFPRPGDRRAETSDRYDERPTRSGSRTQRRARRARRRVSEWMQEIQWLLPVAGGILGVVLALLLDTLEDTADPENWAVTVDQARGTLMGWLSILFAGFGIVLALASLTIQNVVSRFSLRMLRIYQRDLRDRMVIAVFTMTAVYILTEQILLRSFGGDELAPPIGVAMSVALLVLSGVAMIWHMVTITQWFRVDKIARRAASLSLGAAHQVTRARRGSEQVDSGSFSRPEGVADVLAHRSGYVTDVDVDELLDLAQLLGGDIVIDRRTAFSVARGEPIGWVAGGAADAAAAEQVARTVEISDTRVLGGSISYGIVVLVDIAIMALSPAVNDPNTAVEVVEELGFFLPRLAGATLGSYSIVDDAGTQRVTVYASTFGDYVKIATDQIVLYGSQDPLVVQSLNRLANLLCALDLEEADRQVVEEFKARIDGITAHAGSSD